MVGFRIPRPGFRIPKPKIPDSTSQKLVDPGIRNPLRGVGVVPRYTIRIISRYTLRYFAEIFQPVTRSA